MMNIKPVFQEVSSMELTSKHICPVLYCSRAVGVILLIRFNPMTDFLKELRTDCLSLHPLPSSVLFAVTPQVLDRQLLAE